MAVIELIDRDINAIKVDKPKKTDTAKKDKETLQKQQLNNINFRY